MGKFTAIQTYSRFQSLWNENKISRNSLTFILETGQLYTHGIFLNSVAYGAEANGAIDITIAGTSKSLSLSSHTHSNYLEKNKNIDIGTYKIVSGDKDLLYYNAGNTYLGNSTSPVYLVGTEGKIVKGSTAYTLLDTENFSILSQTANGIILSNSALFKYGSKTFSIDYIKRYNSTSNFDSLNSVTSAGTTTVNGKKYGFMTFYEEGASSPSWSQIRIDVADRKLEFRTSSNPTTWISPTNISIPTNTATVAGIVSAPGENNSGKVWKTNASGTPAWRDEVSNTWRNIRINDEDTDSLTTGTDTGALYIKEGSGIKVTWKENKIVIRNNSLNIWKPANTLQEGYIPKLTTDGGTISTQASEYVLTYVSSNTGTVTPVWKLLPAKAFENTWNANAVNVAGYVAAPTKAANANMTWQTDAEGVPAWRASNNHSHSYLPLDGKVLYISGTNAYNSYIKISGAYPSYSNNTCTYLLSSRSGESIYIYCGLSDDVIQSPHLKRAVTKYTKILGIRYSTNGDLFIKFGYYSNGAVIRQIGGGTRDITLTTVTESDYNAATNVTIDMILDSDNSSVSKNDETLTVKINGISQTLTNTWRGIQNNLTSDSTIDSLSAAQGKVLNDKFVNYLPLSGGTMNSGARITVGSITDNWGNIYNGGIQLRERGYAATSLDGTVYTDGPGITFHWRGYWAHLLNMHSDALYWDNTKISLDGHKHAYTDLTGSGTTANQAIVSTGTTNGWTLKTLGNRAFDSTDYLPLAGGTMVGTISAVNESYGGGGFHNGYANIILRGNTTTGTSGIVFSSSKGNTSINRPSDCAFIQYHPYGVSAATAVGTNPTINTSGEAGRFVIGIHNDTGDQLWLQTSAVNDLKHVVGVNVYTIYDSGNLPAYPTKSSWNYDDRYVSSLTISGNQLRWVKNGSNNDITIPYATNADTVDGYHVSKLLHLDGYYYIPGNGNNGSTKLWSKIGSITFTGAWQQCGASLTFYEWEARRMMGELKFNIRTASSKSTAGANIVWMNLTNKDFESSFIICRTGDGTYNIYFEYPASSYNNVRFYIISQYEGGYLTWQNGSALISTEPTYVNERFVSSLTSWVGNAKYANSSNGAPWSGITDKPATATRWPTWDEVTSKPSTFPPSSHTHGTSHEDFFVSMPSQSSDRTWKYNFGYQCDSTMLRAVRVNSPCPDFCAGTYGSGVVFGGGDTKGFMSTAYHTPCIKWAAGNGTSDSDVPNWWMGISGSSGVTYNLAAFLTSQDHYKTSITAGTAGTSSATSGSTLEVPYVSVNADGHVTGYGTHTHTVTGFVPARTIHWDTAPTASKAYIYNNIGYKPASSTRNYFPWIGSEDRVTGAGYGNTISIGAFHVNNGTAGFYIGASWDGSTHDTFYLFERGGTLTCPGNVYAANYYTTSDRSKKQNISSFSKHIRKFQLKDTEKWHYGVIAQEVEEMFRDGEEGNMTVNYNSVLSYYIGQLENRVKELEDEIYKLKNK